MTIHMPRARSVLRPAVAAVAAAAALAGAGTAAANEWLPIFRAGDVAPVGFATSYLVELPDLSRYGDVVVTRGVDVQAVKDADAAAAETGLSVPTVTALPRGVSGEPTYRAVAEASATVTFSSGTFSSGTFSDGTISDGRAAGAATEPSDGPRALPPLPSGLDGTRVTLVAGPGVSAIWSGAAGVPSLVVGRAVAPKAFSSGASFDAVRDHLISLPDMPDDVRTQLRLFSEEGSPLPFPVPEHMTAAPAQVNGVAATALASRDGSIAAVVWVADGIVTVVAGSLDVDEVLAVARELR
jgi:hypothetical protein